MLGTGGKDGVTYDLGSLRVLCEALPAHAVVVAPTSIEAEVAPGAVLCFLNLDPPEDSLIGFKGTPWHVHGGFMFSGRDGQYIEMTAEEALSGLADGSVLICERWLNDHLQDRWLDHRDYLDDFRYMEQGEQIRVTRFTSRQ
jgi:hypothetical protein